VEESDDILIQAYINLAPISENIIFIAFVAMQYIRQEELIDRIALSRPTIIIVIIWDRTSEECLKLGLGHSPRLISPGLFPPEKNLNNFS